MEYKEEVKDILTLSEDGIENTDEEAAMIAAVAATAAMNMLSRGVYRVIIYDPKGCWGCWATLDSACHSLDWSGYRVSSILALLIKIALGMCGDSFDLLPLSIEDKVTPVSKSGEGRDYGDSLSFAKMEDLRWY